MATFTDNRGRQWVVSLTLGDLRRLREAAGVDLARVLTDDTALGRLLYADPDTLGRVLWVLCGDQAKAAELDEAQFADGFDADTFVRCGDALAEAVLGFFHPRQAATVRAGLPGKLRQMDAAISQAIRGQTPTPKPATPNSSGGDSPG